MQEADLIHRFCSEMQAGGKSFSEAAAPVPAGELYGLYVVELLVPEQKGIYLHGPRNGSDGGFKRGYPGASHFAAADLQLLRFYLPGQTVWTKFRDAWDAGKVRAVLIETARQEWEGIAACLTAAEKMKAASPPAMETW